eukprot:4833791-Pleurochrysis_carterae.AAC.2
MAGVTRLRRQRAQCAESDVLGRDAAARHELGVGQRHEGVLLAAQLVRQLDGKLDWRRLGARLLVPGHRRVHLAVAHRKPVVKLVRHARRHARDALEVGKRDGDHVLHLRAEEADRARLGLGLVDQPLHTLAQLAGVDAVRGHRLRVLERAGRVGYQQLP